MAQFYEVTFWITFLCFLRVESSDIMSIVSHPKESVECPSKNWIQDVPNKRCLLLVPSLMSYRAAAASCRVLGTQMATFSQNDNLSLYLDIARLSLNTSEDFLLWSKYHIVNKDGVFYLANEQDHVMPGSRIHGDLENNNTRLCVISFINKISMFVERNRTDCEDKYMFMCEYRLPRESGVTKGSVRGLAIMAICLGIAIAVVMVGTFELIIRQRNREAEKNKKESDGDDKTLGGDEDNSYESDKEDLVSIGFNR